MVVVSHAVVGPEEKGLLPGESCRVPDAGVRDLDALSKSSCHQSIGHQRTSVQGSLVHSLI